MGATSTIYSKCCVVECPIDLQKWECRHSFVIAAKVDKYDMVLGRDFFGKRHNVWVDHGKDRIKVGEDWVSLNAMETVTIAEDDVCNTMIFNEAIQTPDYLAQATTFGVRASADYQNRTSHWRSHFIDAAGDCPSVASKVIADEWFCSAK
jgi:hypothetical protein